MEKSLRAVAEQKVGKKLGNLRVLNSYWVIELDKILHSNSLKLFLLILSIKQLEKILKLIGLQGRYKKEEMKEDFLLLEKNSEDLKRKESLIIKTDSLEMLIIKEESGLFLEYIDKLLFKLINYFIYSI